MTISVQLAMWLVGVIAAGGAFQALVLWRLAVIEKKLGNGEPGIFARREDLDEVRRDYVKHQELNYVCHARHADIMTAVTKIVEAGSE